jgi:hypothetical protein
MSYVININIDHSKDDARDDRTKNKGVINRTVVKNRDSK